MKTTPDVVAALKNIMWYKLIKLVSWVLFAK